MSQLQQLYRLQQLDTEIREKKQRLAEVLQAQKETAELKQARAKAETAASTVQEWRRRRTDLNLELETINRKAKRSENRLYSGKVTNPKELTDLQQEIESLGRRRDVLEDDILEAMIAIEEAEAAKEEADAAYTEIKEARESALDDLKEAQNELALQLHKLIEKREKTAAGIEAKLGEEYDRLRQQKNGVAIAGLKFNVCRGCRLDVSAMTAKRADRGEKVYCDGCGRILYAL